MNEQPEPETRESGVLKIQREIEECRSGAYFNNWHHYLNISTDELDELDKLSEMTTKFIEQLDLTDKVNELLAGIRRPRKYASAVEGGEGFFNEVSESEKYCKELYKLLEPIYTELRLQGFTRAQIIR